MGNAYTRWPVEGLDDFCHILRVDESSSEEEIEAEIEYWMEQIVAYDIPDPYRSSLLQAIKWMNSI